VELIPLSSLPGISQSERWRLRVFAESQEHKEYGDFARSNDPLPQDGLKETMDRTMAAGAGQL